MTSIQSIDDSRPLLPRRTPPGLCRFIVRLGVAFLCSVAAAGTLGSWSVFADMLTRFGTFSDGCIGVPVGRCPSQDEKLFQLYMVSSALTNVCALPSGMMFDKLGPRITSVAGFTGVAVSWAAVVAGLQWRVDWSLWITVTVCMLCTNIASWVCFGFIFFYGHERVGLLVGIGNASFLLSSVTLYLPSVMVSLGHIALPVALLLLFGLAACAACAALVVTPDIVEYKESFEKTYGTPPPPPLGFGAMMQELADVAKSRKLQTFAFVCASSSMAITFNVWAGSVYEINDFALSPSLSAHLASLSVILFAVVGSITSILTGMAYDRIGLPKFLVFVCVLMSVISMSMAWIPTYAWQVVASCAMFTFYSAWLTLESKTPSLLAPPHLYGSFLSASNTIVGIAQLLVSFGLHFLSGNGRLVYLVPVMVMLGVCIILLSLFALVVLFRGIGEEPK